ncbi:MAG: hypothetical protein WA989_05520, partial [Henriciella sp.]|uniref:hypothetical protein n=1 Tax=Henriciella sp. TaxID=1968823 RepID=UPI003C774177
MVNSKNYEFFGADQNRLKFVSYEIISNATHTGDSMVTGQSAGLLICGSHAAWHKRLMKTLAC